MLRFTINSKYIYKHIAINRVYAWENQFYYDPDDIMVYNLYFYLVQWSMKGKKEVFNLVYNVNVLVFKSLTFFSLTEARAQS